MSKNLLQLRRKIRKLITTLNEYISRSFAVTKDVVGAIVIVIGRPKINRDETNGIFPLFPLLAAPAALGINLSKAD